MNRPIAALTALALVAFASGARAQSPEPSPSKDAELAKQLTNPVANLISIPLQNNYDCCYGPQNGYRYTLNIQPVIPMSVSQSWNVIVRTIVPVIAQSESAPGQGFQSGLGDITQSFFFTPKAVRNGLIWAVGPAVLYPTATNDLGSHQWGAGPTALLLKQSGGASYGVLVNQIWSLGHSAGDTPISAAFIQPFLNYTFPSTTGLSANLESSYDWTRRQWTVPLNLGVSHLYSLAGQRISLGGNVRFYLARPADGPDWGLRLTATLLLPKG